jgi:hypothetical protein
VRTLHARPVLTRQMIRDTILDPTFAFLANSNLAEAIELVKFTPIPLSLEELSKLWSVFFQTAYTLSIAYQASLVLIESEETPSAATPIRARNLYIVPFMQPVVERAMAQGGPDQPILADSVLVLRGTQLRGAVTRVRLAGAEVAPSDVSAAQISVSLSALPPGTLRAGVQGVQVVHHIPMGTPPTPHRGFESNVAAFVLRPTITALTVSNVQGSGNAPRAADLTVQVNPTIGSAQRVIVLLNSTADDAPAAYAFTAPARIADADAVTMPISGVRAGDYLVRVQIDGAESPLTVDTDPNSPTFNRYIGPLVTIP